MLGSSEANQRRHWTAEFLCCFISCKLCTCTAYMLKWISSSPDASFPPWSSSQRPFSVSLHLIEHLAGSVARGGRAAGVVRHWVFRVLNNVHCHYMRLFLSRASPCWLHTSAELSPPCGGHYRAASASVPPCRPETSAHALAIVLRRDAGLLHASERRARRWPCARSAIRTSWRTGAPGGGQVVQSIRQYMYIAG